MNVVQALGQTSVGKIKIDRHWAEEGRTKEILDYVSQFSTNISINNSNSLNLKGLSQVINSKNEDTLKADDSKDIYPTKPSPKKSSEKPESSDSYFYTLQTETELRLLEYEEGRLKYLEDIFKSKKDEFENYSKSLEQQTDQQYHLLKRNNELNEKRKAADLEKIEEAIIAEAREKQLLQKAQFQSKAKKLSTIVQEAELKQKKAEEELKRREQEQQEFIQHLNNCKLEVESIALKVKQKLTTFEYPSYLKISIADRLNQISNLLASIQAIEKFLETQSLTIEDISNAYAVVKKTYEFSQDLTNDLELAKVAAVNDHEKSILQSRVNAVVKESNEQNLPVSESAITEAQKGSSVSQKSVGTKEVLKKNATSEAKAVLSAFIAPDTIEEYYRLKENLKAVNDSIQKFVADPNNKKFRFELQKSINVPINAISSVSGSHVREKINRLLSILSSKASNSNNNVIYNFCADLIAKKLVEQGDKQISAQYSTVFPIALVVVGVWQKKPEVGSLILGYFYSYCPYLVPYYPPPQENQSDQDYYKSLGYYFDKDGNIEATSKFLNRISGFIRLYAAIIISPLPPSSVKQAHPHGIANGWRWLSRILNMAPRPDITATLLYDFLDVTGHMLQKTYGEQFKKLLHIICKDFFQKIKKVTPSGSGGPVERLETFLQQAIRKGYVPPPEGMLDSSFWHR